MRHSLDRKSKPLPCVLLDVNTQRDFLQPGMACPVPLQDDLVRQVRCVIAWAKRNQVPVISTVDSHRHGEVRNKKIPPHCIDGTPGQQKMPFTLFGSYVKVEGDNTLAVPIDLFTRHQQVIFRKRTSDLFLNPKADRFITHLPVAEYVLMGLSLEGSIKAITLGLLARGKQVSVVLDCCGYWDRSEADLAVRLMEAKGVRMIRVADLRDRKLPRPLRYPLNSTGQVPLRNGMYGSVCGLPALTSNGRNGHSKHAPKGANGRPHPPAPKPADPRPPDPNFSS